MLELQAVSDVVDPDVDVPGDRGPEPRPPVDEGPDQVGVRSERIARAEPCRLRPIVLSDITIEILRVEAELEVAAVVFLGSEFGLDARLVGQADLGEDI